MPDPTVRLGTYGFGDFSLARLRMLTDFGQVRKSLIWHRRFAEIVREAGYIGVALKEYNRSLSLDRQDWVTLEGIAKCHSYQKQHLQAIEWEQKALATLSQSSDPERADCLDNLCSWYLEVGDMEGAVRAIREALCLEPKNSS